MSDDPHASRPTQWIGKTARFVHEGRTLSGEVIAQEYNGRTKKGNIPDYLLFIRGITGKVMSVSLVESRTSFD